MRHPERVTGPSAHDLVLGRPCGGFHVVGLEPDTTPSSTRSTLHTSTYAAITRLEVLDLDSDGDDDLVGYGFGPTGPMIGTCERCGVFGPP